MKPSDIEQAATLLFHARTTAKPLAELPAALRPATIDEVHAIIGAVDRRIGEPIVGWKYHGKAGGELCVSPLYASRIFMGPAHVPIALAPDLRVEAEVSFRLTRDFPPREKAYSRDDVIGSALACPALELVGSRFVDVHAMAQTRILDVFADHMVNGAFVFGEFCRDWAGFDFSKMRVTMKQDGRSLVDQVGGHPNVGPASLLADFVNLMRQRGGLKTGCYVASGSFTGSYPIEADAMVTGTLGGLGEVQASVIKASRVEQ